MDGRVTVVGGRACDGWEGLEWMGGLVMDGRG